MTGPAIEERIARDDASCFPGLAAELAGRFWQSGSPDTWRDYSTAAALGHARSLAGMVGPIDFGGDLPATLERLPATLEQRFEGLTFATSPALGAAAAITQAATRLAPAAGASEAVAALVRAVHVVAARSGYDCSHSDPALPFSIFVSVPLGERDAELRLAESILHETMHLQLSLIERGAPIAYGGGAVLHSPWQNRARPIASLVHGLYVFACILDWFDAIEHPTELTPPERDYVVRRRTDIRGEIAHVQNLTAAPDLTPFGRLLSRWLIERSLGVHGTLAPV